LHIELTPGVLYNLGTATYRQLKAIQRMMAPQNIPSSAPLYRDPVELLQLLLEAPLPASGTHPPLGVDNQHGASEHTQGGILQLLRALLEASPTHAGTKRSLGGQHPEWMQIASDDLQLLQTLLEALPPHVHERMGPIALRSAEQQRQLVLARVPPASRFNILLLRTQQLLLVAAVLVGGYWFVDGPLYDWMHERRVAPVTRAAGVSRTAVVHRAASPNIGGPSSSAAKVSIAQLSAARARAQGLPAAAPASAMVSLSSVSTAPSPALPEEASLAWRAQAAALTVSTQVPADQAGADAASTPSQMTPTPMILPSIEPIQPLVLPIAEPAYLLIPSIGVDTSVVEVFAEGDEWQSAEFAAGYLHGTARAGEAGNMAISGHLGLRGGVFASLPALQPGADIYVDAAGWRYHYLMRGSQVVWPNQVEVLYPEETTTLTLLTCTNWDTQRLVVTADLMEARPIETQ
jgi:sortase A